MNWEPSYELGLNEIDQQHQFLFERIRMIESAAAIGGTVDFVRSVIVDLERYSVVHFAAEEAIFARHQYPDAEAHCREHRDFVATVLRTKEQLDTRDAMIGDELLGFLREWFAQHILASDFAYGRFLKDQGAL